ncbi:MAG: ribbon-helix-helix domain-containing protein [Bifidobacteriaceae bacterium]|jgi:metal-responsive CopG/Arc/MetJ family transcriptional regulator|nr:ribbon-helix-helix domain-containing protein [Bifidobacteriaceae bacterium]
MKTAISVPDETFARVDTASAQLGVSRSRFFADAAELYLRELASSDLTSRANQALRSETEESAAESRAFVAAGTAAMLARWEVDPW